MKICFYLQRRWAMIGHSMAKHIHENYQNTEFCGFVSTRPSLRFLQEQNDIVYSALLLEEDIHKKLSNEKIDFKYLHWLEQEYGTPNLWPHLYVDRIIMNGQILREYPYNKPTLSYEDMMRRVQVTAKAIIDFLDKEKPDVVVISVIGSVGCSLLYTIAKKRGIKTILIESARIKNRMAFSETYKSFSWVQKYFEQIQSGRISQKNEESIHFLREYREKPKPFRKEADPHFNNQAFRRANLQFLKPKNLKWSILWHIKTFFSDLNKVKNKDYTDIFVWWILWDKLKRKIRGIIGYADLYSKANYNDRFAFYPLHYDPEMSTLLYAPYYTDQVQLIKAIARSLPFGMDLYVKEHPAMLGYRTRKYYKEILSIPNVRLIPPNVSGQEIVQEAELILTITGSTGWDSVLLQKPVITFGDVFYNDLPFVKRCRGFEELPYLIKKQLEDWNHNEETLINYISALLEDSSPVNYMDLWIYANSPEEFIKDSGLTQFTDLLANKLTLQKIRSSTNE